MTGLLGWQAAWLAVLLDALDGVPLSVAERASLTWLAGNEAETVENIAAVLRRAPGAVDWRTRGGSLLLWPARESGRLPGCGDHYTEIASAVGETFVVSDERGQVLPIG